MRQRDARPRVSAATREGSAATMLNSTGGHVVCETGCASAWCTPLGIAIHVIGSVGINLGQNLQALGLERLGAEGLHRPCTSKLWVTGMTVFIISSLVTFSALALASASVLVPLESIQFLVNLLFGRFVRGKQITRRMALGTLILIGGVTMVVCFGVHESYCYDEAALQAFWVAPSWILYLICTFAIAAALYVVWRRYAAARKAKRRLPHHDIVEPVAYTLSSALFGGGQMIVHTKLLAELFELSAASGDVAFARGFFWLELLLVALFGGYWLFRLSQCLAFYDALFIIPLMQTSFIIFGAFAGGTYFNEFPDMAKGPFGANWGGAVYACYALGILLVIVGLGLLMQTGGAPPTDPAEGMAGGAGPSEKQKNGEVAHEEDAAAAKASVEIFTDVSNFRPHAPDHTPSRQNSRTCFTTQPSVAAALQWWNEPKNGGVSPEPQTEPEVVTDVVTELNGGIISTVTPDATEINGVTDMDKEPIITPM